MSSAAEPRIVIDGKYHIIFDPCLVESPTADLFNVNDLKGQGVLDRTVGGRGGSYIIRFPDRAWVLRDYRRGGMVGKILHDQYFGWKREKSRSWSEWCLLDLLYREGFPVPRPVAAAFRADLLHYHAAIVAQFIPDTTTLAEVLTEGELSSEGWRKVGKCIARFHERGVCHADLNAHNILISKALQVFIIDFDKGKIRGKGKWAEANIARLYRSLTKLKSQRPGFSFDENMWKEFLAGYRDYIM